jgi:hypothetical protein
MDHENMKIERTARARNGEIAPRMDFRRASYHLDPKKPCFYLLLLRPQLRGRSLRDKL